MCRSRPVIRRHLPSWSYPLLVKHVTSSLHTEMSSLNTSCSLAPNCRLTSVQTSRRVMTRPHLNLVLALSSHLTLLALTMPAGNRSTEYGRNADRSSSSSPVAGALQLSGEPTAMTLNNSQIQIQVDSETFIVRINHQGLYVVEIELPQLDRNRLAAVCPQFATMFSLPTVRTPKHRPNRL